ncbi:MAG: hypothetical protein IKT70_05860 [Clostridia bacterium]|nr:hypothetical protein [Clostridia bacterium]
MNLTTIIALFTELGVLVAAIMPIIVSIKRIGTGTKCQLRSEMLRIYYRHKETGVLRQYEYENFVLLYEAYRALRGNSFIEKIYSEIKTWKIES